MDDKFLNYDGLATTVGLVKDRLSTKADADITAYLSEGDEEDEVDSALQAQISSLEEKVANCPSADDLAYISQNDETDDTDEVTSALEAQLMAIKNQLKDCIFYSSVD